MSNLDNFEICSNASGMSEVSVSMNGTEMLLEEAVDRSSKNSKNTLIIFIVNYVSYVSAKTEMTPMTKRKSFLMRLLITLRKEIRL